MLQLFLHFLVRTKANCSTLVWVTTGGDMEVINSLTDVLVTVNTPADRENQREFIVRKDKAYAK